MTITLRDILRQYADNGSLDSEYVPVAEYEALEVLITKAQSVINSHNALVSTRQAYEALSKENEALLGLLTKWAEKANDGIIDDTFNGVRSPELDQLIAATKAAVEGQ
jgi:hypothetical protein